MRNFIFLALLLATPVLAQNHAMSLRRAAGCGPAEIKFNVKTSKKQHSEIQPGAGQALVYVFEEYRSDPRYQTLGHVTTRVGLDGNWVGANHESSYFTFAVEPGSHRLCSDVQSIFVHNLSAATDLVAEPGRTYYFLVIVKDERREQPQFRLKPIDGAEGLLLASKFARSTAKAKK